jgi:large subunit ribosomal protein L23
MLFKKIETRDFLKLIKFPLTTEKALNTYDSRQYTFIVNKCLDKEEIKSILEKIYSVKIIRVNTAILPVKNKKVGKFVGEKPVYKKAIITLKLGHSITNLLI